jgi:hypothetical protein
MTRLIRWAAVMLLSGLTSAPVFGSTVLQCVPYARIVSGVDIRGDALNWWGQAEDHYKRGRKPKKGAVLAFKPVGPMTLGHVAVVSKVLDGRRILIRHANWSVPGAIEEDVLAIDVSEEGDWSQVRVWHSPTGQMGARTNPTYGFIYPARGKLHAFEPDPALGASIYLAKVDRDQWNDMRFDEPMKRSRVVPVPAYPRGPMPAQAKVASQPKAASQPADDPFIVEYADGGSDGGSAGRSLGDIIADVKRESTMR